jgi:RNA polymerase sigma-B factor
MTNETNETNELLTRFLGYPVRYAELADCLAEVGREPDGTRSQVAAGPAQSRRHRPGGDGGALHDTSRRPIAPRGPPDPPQPRSEMLPALHRAYAADRDLDLRRELAAIYDDFALAVARRFHTRRESTEDLAQVARIGLLHAIDRFDPALERPFVVFARATIVGELKRHVRDRTWVMRVPRSLQEHYLEVVRAADDLAQELGRSPAILEIAERTGLSEDHVLEAMELGAVQRPASLDAPLPDGKAVEPGTDDPGLAAAEGRAYLVGVLARLPDREREILRLRFVDGLTQTEIGARIGVSQMYVSRMLSRTLTRLRVRVS